MAAQRPVMISNELRKDRDLEGNVRTVDCSSGIRSWRDAGRFMQGSGVNYTGRLDRRQLRTDGCADASFALQDLANLAGKRFQSKRLLQKAFPYVDDSVAQHRVFCIAR